MRSPNTHRSCLVAWYLPKYCLTTQSFGLLECVHVAHLYCSYHMYVSSFEKTLPDTTDR